MTIPGSGSGGPFLSIFTIFYAAVSTSTRYPQAVPSSLRPSLAAREIRFWQLCHVWYVFYLVCSFVRSVSFLDWFFVFVFNLDAREWWFYLCTIDVDVDIDIDKPNPTQSNSNSNSNSNSIFTDRTSIDSTPLHYLRSCGL